MTQILFLNFVCIKRNSAGLTLIVVNHIASILNVAPETIFERKSGHREARRLGMYCVCTYCRHDHSFSELAERFSVSASALTQAWDKVRSDTSRSHRKVLESIENALQKT